MSDRELDENGVDFLAHAMKVKLAKKREQGRGGWNNPDECSAEYLSDLLISHLAKGDLVDIANFCMMLYVRDDATTFKNRMALYNFKTR